ncbi:Segregation and condensation protein A [bioreactor metagenome]|uniref:Segregation and condensation protein A n=1 Tax=bioreactor metagenome TaxID=1076179 RepID=A0A645E8H6_9ZZZZ
MAEKLSYKLDVFEGPLDLLLHLISKHKLNINDIPIVELVEQYVVYVRQMQEENMDIASEFLEMAARLVYIKTVSLLPVHEEAEQLKIELTGELLEYRECQLIAKRLSEQTDGFDLFSRQPQDYEPDHQYRRLHEPFEILKAYISAVGKGKRKLPPPVEAFSGIIAHKIVSVSSRISAIVQRLLHGKKERFITFFTSAESKSELVATFLAMLELAKSKRIHLIGDGENTEVEIMNGGENS